MAMLTDMLRRDRERWGMTEAEAARRFRVSLRAYREIEAGERMLDFATYDAICKTFGWPQAFVRSALTLG
jgi:hypothetical protein